MREKWSKESVRKNYQLLKASEGCATCDEESTIVQLPENFQFFNSKDINVVHE